MSPKSLQFCSPAEATTIVGYDFMATTSKDYDLDQELPPSYPVSTHFTPIFSPALEYHGPDSTPSLPTSQKSAVRPLAPRKGSPRREGYIPRPRNAFMIFRSEYHQAKITTDVERDHRHISRIVGHLWNTMSDEDKAPYRLAAEKEKAEHQRKYPGYRFCPGTRTSKPVKRKVKRNGQTDLARSQKVAELLKAGLQGRELESAIKDIDFESLEGPSTPSDSDGSSPSPYSSPYTQASPTLPDVRGWQPHYNHPPVVGPVFRSPLLAPSAVSSTVPDIGPIAPRPRGKPFIDYLKPDPPEASHITPTAQPSASFVDPAYVEPYQTFQANVAQSAHTYQFHHVPQTYNAAYPYQHEPQFLQYHAPHSSAFDHQPSAPDPYVSPVGADGAFYTLDTQSSVPVDMTFQNYEDGGPSAYFAPENSRFGSVSGIGTYEFPIGQVPDSTNSLRVAWDPNLQSFVNV